MSIDELRNSIRRKTIHFEVALNLERPYTELKTRYNEIKDLLLVLNTAEILEKRSKKD